MIPETTRTCLAVVKFGTTIVGGGAARSVLNDTMTVKRGGLFVFGRRLVHPASSPICWSKCDREHDPVGGHQNRIGMDPTEFPISEKQLLITAAVARSSEGPPVVPVAYAGLLAHDDCH
jgi:hypothetical protein